MTKNDSPPFVITPGMLADVAEIAERLGRSAVAAESAGALRLRRVNRIRTIHGSLAIEGNTLNEQQISAILEGKPVIAPPRENAHQQDYYRALAESNAEGASTLFVEFMLGVIREALMSASTEQVTEQVRNLLALMGEGDYSAKSLMALMGLSHRPTFLYDYLHPALAGGWLELTRPETPKSPKQGYRLTRSGRQLVLALRQHD